tara:strand:+ start:846 stop:1463 length:618 start_codon:yes stop_codon:yes gene_type:complete
MANHVYFNIELSLDAGQTALVEKLGKSCETRNGEMQWLSYEVEKLPIYPVPYNENDWYSWGCEQMGAKWVSVEDWNEHYISGYSAWSPCIPFLTNLIQYIYDQVGGMPTAKMTYEDEFRNFIGKCEVWIDTDVGSGEVNWDYEDVDGAELNETMEDWSGWDTSSEDFQWWDLTEAKNGEKYEPQEVIDEMVYGFFEDGKVEVRHD